MIRDVFAARITEQGVIALTRTETVMVTDPPAAVNLTAVGARATSAAIYALPTRHRVRGGLLRDMRQ
jgi:hypothetical protein